MPNEDLVLGDFETEPEERYLANLEDDIVCASIAALTAGIYQVGVNFGVMPDDLQMFARYDNTHGFRCVTRPNKMVIAIILNKSGAIGDCGSEDRQGSLSRSSAIRDRTLFDRWKRSKRG